MSEPVLPASARIGRVALRVADLPSVARFYESVVGLERLADHADVGATATGEERAVLGAGGEPLLYLEAAPELPPRDRRAAGLYHLAVRVPDRAALGSAVRRIRDAGRLEGAADHLVSEAVYCSDPEGNGVEVYADRPREEWEVEGDRLRIDTLPLDVDALVANADGAAVVPPGADVGHVHLEVTDLQAARQFYVVALGTNVRQDAGRAALFVAAGDYHHHVGLNTWERRTEPAGETRGLAWFELLVPDRDALSAATERFRDARYDASRSADAVALCDPDGIELRLRVEE